LMGGDVAGVYAACGVGGSRAAAAPPARGVLVVMPRRREGRHRSPWRRRVDPGAVAGELRGGLGE
jgi:hypothetical protein